MSKTESEVEDLTTDSASVRGFRVAQGEGEEQGGILGYEFEAQTDRFNTEDFISRPWFSDKCDIEENILEFDFSFGYDCKKPYNLVRVDEHTLIFASGNLIHFFNVDTKEVWFRRSAFGGGIGHITKNLHPDFPHIAIGENGIDPPIIIYEWPSLEIMCVLKYGTTRRYSHLNYSPDGTLLVSQGGDPDYLITVWNWPKSTILLRTKSYVNDVLRVMFSPEVPGHITSCGIAHIKFWKMARTFTGLKLQGDIGRFGKTEYSDIIGIYPMADEKVISGCYWGNILVWDEGLIKLEVTRKGRKRCHEAAIVQFDYKNGELWTVGMDGRVRIWYYDTIDQADPPDEDRVVEMEPTYDFYTPGAEFMCILKQYDDPDNAFYFAQDGRGGIWRIDLTTDSDNVAPSERLLKCHAGVAESLSVCPWGPFFTTLGNGGRLHLYDYLERKLLMVYMFPARGCCLIWVPLKIDPSGEVVIVSLADGSVRVIVLKVVSVVNKSRLHLIQLTKPHTSIITCMKFNRTGEIFVTASKDKTIFLFQVIPGDGFRYMQFVPIGYVNMPDIVVCITLHNHLDYTLLLGGSRGFIISVELPKVPQPYTTISYVLDVKQSIQRFTTVKSQILRDIKLKEIEKRQLAKRQLKQIELEKFKKDNPGLDVDEEIFLADSESEEKLEALYIPEVPNRIMWMQHTQDDTLWLSLGGYDAGYIYEYKIGENLDLPVRCTTVYKAEHAEINNFVYSKNRDFLIFAMEDGSIRVNRINPNNWRDLSNFWQLNMHDNFNGFIAGMEFSYDQTYFITCGHDGNIFTFRFFPDNEESEGEVAEIERLVPPEESICMVDDVSCEDVLSLEQTIVKAEVDRINQVANDNKDVYMEKLSALRNQYETVLFRNASLPQSQQIPVEDLEVDPRVTENLNEKLLLDQALVHRKLAFDVEKSALRMSKMKGHFLDSLDVYPIVVTAIRSNDRVQCLPMRALGEDFEENLRKVDLKIAEDELKGRPPDRPPVVIPAPPAAASKLDKLEYFLVGLSPSTISHKLGGKIYQLLDKYRKRKQKRDDRLRQWDAYYALKPTTSSSDAEDETLLKEAIETIGDYKLKSAHNYKIPHHLRESTFKKYKELLLVRERHYNHSHDFNKLVYELRDEKKRVLEFLIEKTKVLAKIHEEIDPEDHAFGPEIFEMSEDLDFPDRGFEIRVEMPAEETGNVDGKQGNQKLEDTLTVREILHTIEDIEPMEQEVQSVWELALRKDRYRLMLFEQTETIRFMELAIENFNEAVRNLRLKRISISVASNLVNLHLLTLHQELMILKECEAKEDMLAGNVNTKMIELMDIQDRTVEVTSQIDIYKKKIMKLEEKEKELQRSFMSAASENKFFDFLRRIFKKKYKVPKVHGDSDSDSDSSSSSSSESEDVDAGSIDSKDFGIIRLDETVCPKGCDPNIFDLTYELRTQRHAVEQEIRDLTRTIDQDRKDYETLQKRSRVIEANLKKSEEELETFQREKQCRLNKIMCTVILKLTQIQNFDQEAGGMREIVDSLVFSKKVLSRLYRRVGELQVETQQQTSKHKLSVTHLNKMRTDFRTMTYTKKLVKAQSEELMRIQFGGKVNLDELQEYLLKKLIFDYKLTSADIKSMFTREIDLWYEIHREKQKEARRALKINTTKFDVLTMITRERSQLAKLFGKQDALRNSFERVVTTVGELKEDIRRLQKIVDRQEEDMEILRKEIKLYKTKGYALKPDHPPFPEEPPEDVEEDDEIPIPEWEYLDDYKYTEEYAIEYWKDKADKAALQSRQQCIMEVMEELFENIRVELTNHQIGKLLNSVISDVMDKCDIEQIISDLLAAIPLPLTDDQQSLIELTAEKLYSVEEFEVNEEIRQHSMEIFHRILDDILGSQEENPSIKFDILLSVLTENLPLDMILDQTNFQAIMARLRKSDIDLALVRQKIHEEDSLEVKALVAEILGKLSEKDFAGI